MEKDEENMQKNDSSSIFLPSILGEDFKEMALKGVLNARKLDSLKIDNENFHSILGNALIHKSYHLTKKCEKFIEDRSGIDINFAYYRNFRIIYHSGDNSLAFIENKIITPLIDIFKSYTGISPESHRLELLLTHMDDESYLEYFIEKYGLIISKISIVATEHLNDKLLIQISRYCENLNLLEIFCFDHLSATGLSFIQYLSNLELISLQSAYYSEPLEIKNCKNLKVLEIFKAEKSSKIEVNNMPNLRRLEISKCPDLESLSIIECLSLEEIFVFDCPKLSFDPQIEGHTKLKFCKVNGKKYL